MEVIQFLDTLFHNLLVFLSVDNLSLVPLLAHEALGAIFPNVSVLYFISSQDSCEYDVIHIACHWILEQEIISNLVDSHEHESHFSSRPGSLHLVSIVDNSFLDPVNLECVLHDPQVIVSLFISLLQVTGLFLRGIAVLVHVVKTHVFEVRQGLSCVQIYVFLLLVEI